eukprot:52262-Rhodomonas_salina.1
MPRTAATPTVPPTAKTVPESALNGTQDGPEGTDLVEPCGVVQGHVLEPALGVQHHVLVQRCALGQYRAVRRE